MKILVSMNLLTTLLLSVSWTLFAVVHPLATAVNLAAKVLRETEF